ncbi:MAG: general secretion pathway protein GspK [Candidatus Omnitrophica bacterium]|nr:general secretion pathway protein GspK [Candidatus Omnitrophota bacterium]
MIVGLWVLAILSIFAVGLGHRASIALKLARYQKDKLSASFLAKGAFYKAAALLGQDIKSDSPTKDYDAIAECGVNMSGSSPQYIFSYSGEGKNKSFVIGYEDPGGNFIYGMRDEESRLNMNKIIEPDKRILWVELFRLKGIADVERLADTIIDWLDVDKDNRAGGIESAIFKNEGFSVPEELIIALEYFYDTGDEKEREAKAKETFSMLKDLVTVYSGSVNINTASLDVFKVIFRAAVISLNNPSLLSGYADSLAEKIDNFRKGYDGLAGTSDDNVFIDMSSLAPEFLGNLGPEEAALMDASKDNFCVKSDIFRISTCGYSGKVKKTIECVYDRRQMPAKKILYWHES